MKFSPFPQMINQNEAVLLCPLPVIFRMSEGDQDSKEEVKISFAFIVPSICAKEIIRVKM